MRLIFWLLCFFATETRSSRKPEWIDIRPKYEVNFGFFALFALNLVSVRFAFKEYQKYLWRSVVKNVYVFLPKSNLSDIQKSKYSA